MRLHEFIEKWNFLYGYGHKYSVLRTQEEANDGSENSFLNNSMVLQVSSVDTTTAIINTVDLDLQLKPIYKIWALAYSL